MDESYTYGVGVLYLLAPHYNCILFKTMLYSKWHEVVFEAPVGDL